MTRLFSSVWHTGTQYVTQHHEPDAAQIHCTHEMQEFIMTHDGPLEICTTYRDPLRVGASWANRYLRDDHEMFLREFEPEWMTQWELYSELLTMDPEIYYVEAFDKPKVKSKPDKHLVHRALDRGDLEAFHQVIPHHWIEHALSCSAGARA